MIAATVVGRHARAIATSTTRTSSGGPSRSTRRAAHAARGARRGGARRAAVLLANLLRPARPEPVTASREDLERARAAIAAVGPDARQCRADGRQAPAVQRRRECVPDVPGRGPQLGRARRPGRPGGAHEELVWRFRELSDRHGGWTVFYQASRERLAALRRPRARRIQARRGGAGAARRLLARGQRARDLRQAPSPRGARRRHVRGRARERRAGAAAAARSAISDAWLERQGRGREALLRRLVRPRVPAAASTWRSCAREGEIVAFANLWAAGTKRELSVDLMRFGPDAPRSAMDFLFVELMLWGRAQGYALVQSRHGAARGARAAPARARVAPRRQLRVPPRRALLQLRGPAALQGEVPARCGSRAISSRPGGMALPRILLDVSALIAGGIKELFGK